jgi:hypothetical protein
MTDIDVVAQVYEAFAERDLDRLLDGKVASAHFANDTSAMLVALGEAS